MWLNTLENLRVGFMKEVWVIGYNPNLSDKNKQEEAQGNGYPFLLRCLGYYNYYYYICLVIMDVWR